MDQESVTRANRQVGAIIGLRGIAIGRAADMAWIVFGSEDLCYSLHLQCAFRIRSGERILTTNPEMYYPARHVVERPDYDPDNFDWDVQGDNRYDEWVRSLDPEFTDGVKVVDAKVNSIGDLTVRCDQDFIIEVFMNWVEEECWRFFRFGDDFGHLVVTGRGLEN
jgi:hypothetical protein